MKKLIYLLLHKKDFTPMESLNIGIFLGTGWGMFLGIILNKII